MSANPGPSGWDKYGGLSTGPQLKAAGFFRTEKYNGKWWLVGPEGYLFWLKKLWKQLAEADVDPITLQG